MRVLFICRYNPQNGISVIISNQGKSLENIGWEVDYYCIKGKGIWGYFKSILPIRRKIIQGKYSRIHAHYSLSAYTTSLAGANDLVVSLMGSDVQGMGSRLFLKLMVSLFRWKKIIVKSEAMKKILGLKQIQVLPNGVDISQFKPLPTLRSKLKVGIDAREKVLLFAANPNRYEKNYSLFTSSLAYLKGFEFKIIVLDNSDHSNVPTLMNSADVVVLTSLWEGSPNVIKEAMACNRPIVSTKVGDVEWLFGDEPGHYITGFDPTDVAEKLQLAIEYASRVGQTNGRDRIMSLGLDSGSIARKLITLYEDVLQKNN